MCVRQCSSVRACMVKAHVWKLEDGLRCQFTPSAWFEAGCLLSAYSRLAGPQPPGDFPVSVSHLMAEMLGLHSDAHPLPRLKIWTT